MKNIFLTLLVLPTLLFAESNNEHANNQLDTSNKQELNDVIQKNQDADVEVISLNGSVTRAKCPYTCEMRGLSKENCKTWPAPNNPGLCYVWDTRLPQNAVPLK